MPSLTAQEVLSGPATEIGRAIRERVISAEEVLDLHLQRIEDRNGSLNAIVTLVEGRAREAARLADHELAQNGPRSPLHGVPFTVKDIIATEGIRTTGGSLTLADYVPPRSAPAVTRLEEAGAILVGKSNCPEFALDLHTWNRLFGGTRNPWAEGRTPGGSSGGESASVASGCSAFGIGTDYGGSIRWPAHCTGLVSLRPTPGVIPATGQLPYSSDGPLPPPNSFSVQGRLQVIAPIGRAVADLWNAMRIMAGPDHRDESCVPVPLGDPDRVDLARLRCAWFDGDGKTSVRADLLEAVEEAARYLSSLGVETLAQRPPGIEHGEDVFAPLRVADGLPDHAALVSGRPALLTDNMIWWFEGARTATVEEYRRCAASRDELRAQVLDFMQDWPLLLLPTASVPAFEVDQADFSIDPTQTFRVEGQELSKFGLLTCTRIISVLGVPAAVVPVGTSREGLPSSVQIVGRPFADHEVIALANALEDHFGPWRPPTARAVTSAENPREME